MSKIQPLPKFRPGHVVRMYTENVLAQTEDDISVRHGNTVRTIIESQIVEHHYAPTLGWVYELKNLCGLVREDLLSLGDQDQATSRLLDDPEETPIPVDVPTMLQLHADAKFKVGNYIQLDGDLMDGVALTSPVYGIVMGVTFIHGEIVYDCALRDAHGVYVEDDLGFGEEDLVLLSDAERETLLRGARVKPKLTMVSSDKH